MRPVREVPVVSAASAADRVRRYLRKRFGTSTAAVVERESLRAVGRGWMGTASGRQFWPLEPRAEDVDVADIVRGLAMTCRYGGQVKRYYSVAEHCVVVSRHVDPRFAREALFHDCAEAYIGDMIRPLKHQAAMKPFREAEAAIEEAVFEALGLAWTPESHAAVKTVDNAILVDEIKLLSAAPHMYLETPLLKDQKPLGAKLRCLDPVAAEVSFMTRYRELFA